MYEQAPTYNEINNGWCTDHINVDFHSNDNPYGKTIKLRLKQGTLCKT